jgi:hypothetical protein
MIYTIDRLNQMIFNTDNNKYDDKYHFYNNLSSNNDKVYVKGRIDWVFIIY